MDAEYLLRYNEQLRKSLPIECGGVFLYPVLFDKFEAYESFIHCLTYDPIYYPDAELSSLPRLYFLTSALKEEQGNSRPERQAFLMQLIGLMKLVLREDQPFDFAATPSGQIGLVVHGDKSVTINAKKFDDMRRIILLQNDTAYDDRYIHPDILRWIEEQKALERKHISNKYVETTEDKVEALMLSMGQTDEHFVDSMTIRRVNRLSEKNLNREIFNAQLQGSFSGMVKFKEDPVSWAVTKPKPTDFDKYLRELNARQ